MKIVIQIKFLVVNKLKAKKNLQKHQITKHS